MKKIFIILGVVFLALILAGGIGLFILNIKGNALDKESKEYTDSAVMAIVKDWNPEELTKRMSPELEKTIKPEDLEKLFGLFKKLGALKEYKGAKGDANISVTSEHGKIITAHYVANAEFEAGPAEIKINVIKHNDQWQILGFNVNSKVFLPEMQSENRVGPRT